MSRDDVSGLSEESDVEFIWLDEEIHTCLDRSVPAISVPAVWNAGYRGTGIKVAIVDTGIDRTHPDFAGRIVDGASFVGGDYQDDNGHGTHVASICAGSGAAQGGTYVGVAPEARLYVAKVLDRGGSGSMSGVMAGVEWAVDRGVQVINLSLGGSGSSDGTGCAFADLQRCRVQGDCGLRGGGQRGADGAHDRLSRRGRRRDHDWRHRSRGSDGLVFLARPDSRWPHQAGPLLSRRRTLWRRVPRARRWARRMDDRYTAGVGDQHGHAARCRIGRAAAAGPAWARLLRRSSRR